MVRWPPSSARWFSFSLSTLLPASMVCALATHQIWTNGYRAHHRLRARANCKVLFSWHCGCCKRAQRHVSVPVACSAGDVLTVNTGGWRGRGRRRVGGVSIGDLYIMLNIIFARPNSSKSDQSYLGRHTEGCNRWKISRHLSPMKMNSFISTNSQWLQNGHFFTTHVENQTVP